MARSKKNVSDSDIGSDSDFSDLDYDEPLPPKTTTEDAFNNIFRGGTTLPTRTRKKPQPYGSTPTPPPSKSTTKKKNTKKTSAPLVNSTRSNQSSNTTNKKRTRKSPSIAKSSTAPPITSPAPHLPLTLPPNGALLS